MPSHLDGVFDHGIERRRDHITVVPGRVPAQVIRQDLPAIPTQIGQLRSDQWTGERLMLSFCGTTYYNLRRAGPTNVFAKQRHVQSDCVHMRGRTMTKFGSRVVFGTGEARVAPANSRAIWASILSTRRIYARNACSRPRPRDGATPTALPRAAHSAHQHLISERARAPGAAAQSCRCTSRAVPGTGTCTSRFLRSMCTVSESSSYEYTSNDYTVAQTSRSSASAIWHPLGYMYVWLRAQRVRWHCATSLASYGLILCAP